MPRSSQRHVTRIFRQQRAANRPSARSSRVITPVASVGDTPVGPTNGILAETGDFLQAEDGNYLVQE